MYETVTGSHAWNRLGLRCISLHFLKQVFETDENRCRQSQSPLLWLVESCHLDRNSSSGWKRIGNNVKSLAIHANVVGRTVAEAFNPSAVVSDGFVGWIMHHPFLFFGPHKSWRRAIQRCLLISVTLVDDPISRSILSCL